MKKMMLLASIVALTAMMLAAAPAFADDNHNGRNDFCDHHDCFDNNNNDNNNDGDVFRNIGNDRLNINGPDFGDVGVDSNSSIDVSPTQTVNGGGEINQAAAASSQ